MNPLPHDVGDAAAASSPNASGSASSPASAQAPAPSAPRAAASASSSASASANPLSEKQMMLRFEFSKPTFLPLDYEPTSLDVFCGRGKKNWRHQGNVNFRKIIRSRVDSYIAAPTKQDKSAIVVSVVDDIRLLGGKFLKQQEDAANGRWFDIGDQQAREKAGHSLRDQVTAISKNKDRKQPPLVPPSRKKDPPPTMSSAASSALLSTASSGPPLAATTSASGITALSRHSERTSQDFNHVGGGVSPHSFLAYQHAMAATQTQHQLQQQQQQQQRLQQRSYSDSSIPSAVSSLLMNSFAKRPSMGLDEHVTHGLGVEQQQDLEPLAHDELRVAAGYHAQHHLTQQAQQASQQHSMQPHHNHHHHRHSTTSMDRPSFQHASFVDAMEQGRVRLEPNFQQPLDASVEPTPIEQMLDQQKGQQSLHQQQQKEKKRAAATSAAPPLPVMSPFEPFSLQPPSSTSSQEQKDGSNVGQQQHQQHHQQHQQQQQQQYPYPPQFHNHPYPH